MKHVIYAVSGGTGRTVYQALKTVLPQFFSSSQDLEEQVEIVRRAEGRDGEAARAVAEEAAQAGGIVFHTLFDDDVEMALIMSAKRLEDVRRARATRHKGVDLSRYKSFEGCQEEIRRTQRLATEYGWKKAYVSNRAVEEVVSRVAELMKR